MSHTRQALGLIGWLLLAFGSVALSIPGMGVFRISAHLVNVAA